MNRVFLALFLLFSCYRADAQQQYFVFINHENKLPFYVRMGETIYSSSIIGHLTLAPLTDSVYIMYIGFPRSRAAELAFEVRVDHADRGLLLDRTDQSWRLTDLLTGVVINPISNPGAFEGEMQKKTDSFSQLMADVVDDSTVLYSAAGREIQRRDSSKTVLKKGDTVRVAALAKTNAGQQAAKTADSIKRAGTLRMQEVQAARKENGVPADSSADQLQKRVVSTKAGAPPAAPDSSMTHIKGRLGSAEAGLAGADSAVFRPQALARVDSTKADAALYKEGLPALRHGDIIRVSTEVVGEGRLFIYVDRTGPVADTIRLIIPRL